MAKPTTGATSSAFPLVTTLVTLLVAHRPAFGQEGPYQRATGLVVGWLLTLGRQTRTRTLVALG